jgi:hypothetical protein
MYTLSQQHSKTPLKDGAHFLATWIQTHQEQLSESFWCGLTFILFLIAGPFAAIAVLIGLGSLASAEKREQMREPERI